MKRKGIIDINQDILRMSRPESVPVKFNGETVGTASNIQISKTGTIKAVLDLAPEIQKLVENDIMQSSCNLPEKGTSSEGNVPAEPATLEKLAETLAELEESRPTVKKSEFFAHPEQAPEWLADEFEILNIVISEKTEQGKMLIVRDPADIMGGASILLSGMETKPKRATVDRVIISIHPEDLRE